jgi:NADH:ubiquinone oxidoreductase subunit 3 (subunit A)
MTYLDFIINDNILLLYIFFFIYIFLNILIILNYFINNYIDRIKNYEEKNESFECGFNPFDEGRIGFDIHYYLIALLFLIFDLEIMLLYP